MHRRLEAASRRALGAGLTVLACWGCSGTTDNSGGANSSSGGSSSKGGSMAGGSTSQTGTSTGGTVSAGGTATGGTSTTGGSTSAGGSTTAGGSVATGGVANNGGSTSSGGTTTVSSTGGKASSGGSTNQGGASVAGGSTTTGGTSGASGNSTNGGKSGSASGGSAAGGTSASGGSSGTAGKSGSASGGAATGGTSSVASGGSGTASCPSPALKSGDSNKTITVGGLSREYILHVPSAYTGSTAVPLVLDFHPIGGSASAWRTSSPYPAVIDKEGVISVFPNGKTGPMGNAWNVKGCCVSQVNGADVDDVAFAKAIVAEVEKVACIDPKRVYAVGFSMGGGMSNYLACHAADVFAAVGPAAFDLTQQNEPTCIPARPITVIEWRGKNDNVVPYAGGHSALVSGMAIDFLGAVGTFQKWASKDGCTGSPSAADSNGCQTYSQCSAGVQVTLCTANNGGHDAANASVVWPMLKKYTMP